MIDKFLNYFQQKMQNIQYQLEPDKLKIEIANNKKLEMSKKDWFIDNELSNRIVQIKSANKNYLLKKFYIPQIKKNSVEIDGVCIDESLAFCLAQANLMRDHAEKKLDDIFSIDSYMQNVHKQD